MGINEDEFIRALNHGETFITEHQEVILQKQGGKKQYCQNLKYRPYDEEFQKVNEKKLKILGILTP